MRYWVQWFVGLSGISEPKVLPETFRQVMYALACATGRKARKNGGILWYLLVYVCLGMRSIVSAERMVCGVPVSDARRMSWHTQLTSPWCHGGPDRVRDGGENTERRFNA